MIGLLEDRPLCRNPVGPAQGSDSRDQAACTTEEAVRNIHDYAPAEIAENAAPRRLASSASAAG